MPAKEQWDPAKRPDWDWLKLKFRVQLLPRNPHFKDGITRIRKELSIPEQGFPDLPSTSPEDALGKWLARHLTEHPPVQHEDWESIVERNPHGLFRSALGRFKSYYRIRSPILLMTFDLLKEFGLPEGLFKDLTWHVLMNRSIPVPNPIVTEEVGNWPDYWKTLDEHEAFPSAVHSYGLPEMLRGELVVISMIVNEYTTKQELINLWEQIKLVKERYCQGRQVPNRRRSGPKVEQTIARWLEWYLARRVEGKSLRGAADQFDVGEETARYGIDQIHELMQPVTSRFTKK